MPSEFRTSSAEETRRLGACLAPLLAPADVVVLSGDLGAGKTVLVKGVAEGLGVDERVTSPTFGILAVHPGRLPLYHFDLYRLEDESQLEDIGFDDIIEADGASFLEWGDRFTAALPADRLDVTITLAGAETREIMACARGERSAELEAAWARAWEART